MGSVSELAVLYVTDSEVSEESCNYVERSLRRDCEICNGWKCKNERSCDAEDVNHDQTHKKTSRGE